MEEKKVKKEELNEEDLKQATGGIYEQAGKAHLRPVKKCKRI